MTILNKEIKEFNDLKIINKVDNIIVYYLAKGLKIFCMPYNVFDLPHCVVFYELHDEIVTLWESAPVRTKKASNVSSAPFKEKNRLLHLAITSFFKAIYEFDAEGIIDDEYSSIYEEIEE